MTEIEQPYASNEVEYHAHDINPLDEEKRIRVFGGQLMDAIVDDASLENFNWSIGWFFGQGINLISKFPNRETELNKILITFWRKMQLRYKILKGE